MSNKVLLYLFLLSSRLSCSRQMLEACWVEAKHGRCTHGCFLISARGGFWLPYIWRERPWIMEQMVALWKRSQEVQSYLNNLPRKSFLKPGQQAILRSIDLTQLSAFVSQSVFDYRSSNGNGLIMINLLETIYSNKIQQTDYCSTYWRHT